MVKSSLSWMANQKGSLEVRAHVVVRGAPLERKHSMILTGSAKRCSNEHEPRKGQESTLYYNGTAGNVMGGVTYLTCILGICTYQFSMILFTPN
jgi:hypothetical protein